MWLSFNFSFSSPPTLFIFSLSRLCCPVHLFFNIFLCPQQRVLFRLVSLFLFIILPCFPFLLNSWLERREIKEIRESESERDIWWWRWVGGVELRFFVCVCFMCGQKLFVSALLNCDLECYGPAQLQYYPLPHPATSPLKLSPHHHYQVKKLLLLPLNNQHHQQTQPSTDVEKPN